jgi:hypothetical protein
MCKEESTTQHCRVVPRSSLVINLIHFSWEKIFGMDKRFDLRVCCKKVFFFPDAIFWRELLDRVNICRSEYQYDVALKMLIEMTMEAMRALNHYTQKGLSWIRL